jgi:hypothetical protein
MGNLISRKFLPRFKEPDCVRGKWSQTGSFGCSDDWAEFRLQQVRCGTVPFSELKERAAKTLDQICAPLKKPCTQLLDLHPKNKEASHQVEDSQLRRKAGNHQARGCLHPGTSTGLGLYIRDSADIAAEKFTQALEDMKQLAEESRP